jgi:hypothetical protein
VAILYVAKSQRLAKWGASVGVTKHLYKVGLAIDTAEAAVKALNQSAHAGETDWKLVKKEETEAADEQAVLDRLAQKEKRIDPAFYPKIKGAPGIFKVKITNVENYILLKLALAGAPTKAVKVTPAEIAGYLLYNALR